MNRWIPRLLFLEVFLCGLAALRGILPGCASCGGGVRPSDFAIGLSGAAFYFYLWWTALTQGRSTSLFVALAAAAGTHAGLLARMAADGAFCVWCVLAAAGCFLLLTLLFLDRSAPRRSMAAAAAIALAVVLASAFLRPAPVRSTDPVRLVVYEKDNCGYCRDLKHDVLPEILRQFPGRVSVEYRPADAHDWVRRTPTILIEGRSPEIIEGLPSAGYLRRRIELRLPDPQAAR